MKTFFYRLQKFFTIENPLLIVSFLFLIVCSRFVVTYFNEDRHVRTPDANFYAGEFVGHDLVFATTDQAYRLLDGLPMQLGVGYGYTFTILTAWILGLFNLLGLCNPANQVSCDFLFYKVVVVTSIVGLVSLVFLLTEKRNQRSTAAVFLIAFLLGVPGGMGIESGNLDIFLSVLYGFVLLLQQISLMSKRKYLYPILLGIIAGALLQTKLFFLPIVFVFLFCSKRPLLFSLSLLATAIVIAIIPGFYNVPIDPLYALRAAQTLREDTYLSSEIVYGNNSTRAMVGGIVFAVPALHTTQFVREVLVNVGGGLLFLLVLVSPIFARLVHKPIRFVHAVFQDRLQYKFFIVLNCCAVSAVILWPEISLAYRFFYLIPLIFVLVDTSKNTLSKQAMGLALSALLIRSLFVWHSRSLHVFLLVFFYFFILASISIWQDSSKIATITKKARYTR